MKNLEIYGVQEMIDVNGGASKFWKAFGKTALIVGICCVAALAVI